MNNRIESFDPQSGKEINSELLRDILSYTTPIPIITEILGIIKFELKTKHFNIDKCNWMCFMRDDDNNPKHLIPYSDLKATQQMLLSKFN
jgi:hypothetical protein